MSIPVITIDGPSASGKGTVAALLAERLGFHYLDSGSLYRVLALFAQQQQLAWDDEQALAKLAASLPVQFLNGKVWLKNHDVSILIRAEAIGEGASQVAALPQVRAALLQLQRSFCQLPGLVSDGRDMGSVVFPDAYLKVFLTASAEERANRRYKQLINKGESANLAQIMQDIIIRDERDATREVAPLRQEADACLLDTTKLSITEAIDMIEQWWKAKGQTA